jgi:hypothetical protein
LSGHCLPWRTQTGQSTIFTAADVVESKALFDPEATADYFNVSKVIWL